MLLLFLPIKHNVIKYLDTNEVCFSQRLLVGVGGGHLTTPPIRAQEPL